MDEKLRIEIDYILAEVANHSNRYPDEDDAAHAIEQAFRDAHWIEPQQPEGEWAPCPPDCTKVIDCCDCEIRLGMKAQRAHDKTRMVPSEDELKVLLLKAHDNAIMTTFPHKTTMAHELLKLLGEEKP